MNKPNDVDEYIASFSGDLQKILKQLRSTIRQAAPEVEEIISYQMPAYKLGGALVYFAAYKNDIGFYPTASAIKAYQEDISAYKNSKGAVQFPIDEPLPTELITKIVRFKARENLEKAKTKAKK